MSAGIVTPTIGFVGLGRMGGPMSWRLIDAGFSLCVFDTSADALAALQEAGSAIAASPEHVGDSADIVFVSLPTPDIVEQVVLTGVGRGSRAKIVVDLSTSGSGMAGRVSRGLEPRGIAWIDAPVSGGIAGAKGGTLAVMASGPRAAFESVESLLKNFGKVFFARREGWPRAGRQAWQQFARRSGHGHLFRSVGDGRQGGDRPQDHARHHQRR